MSVLKMSLFLIVIFSFCLTGCIRHSDQPLPKKLLAADSTQSDKVIKKIIPNLMVNDVNQTIEFYKYIAGFEVITTVPDTGHFDFAILAKDGVELMVQRNENYVEEFPVFRGKEIGGTFSLFIEVDDILPIYDKASAQTEIVKELHQTFYGTKEFSLKDNNGYILTFSEALR